MKLLVDQNLPRSLAARLTDRGYDVVHTTDAGLEKAADPDVFAYCVAHRRALITGDKKLTKFLASSQAISPSVIIVRDYEFDIGRLSRLLAENLPLVQETVLSRGHAVFSVGPNRPTRVQILPLGSLA